MDKLEEIKRLKALRNEGAISENEFNRLKKYIIDEDPLIKVVDSKSIDNSETKTNVRSSLFKRVVLYCLPVLILASAYAGIKYFIAYKQEAENEKRIQITDDLNDINNKEKNGNVVYQDGKEIGRIVKKNINTVYPHSGSGVTTLDIPQGKMWTPLYYEFTNGNPSYPEVWIYPVKRRGGWAYADSYRFEESKQFFISVKYARQNFDAFTSKSNPAVSVFSNSRAVCTFYFFEESVY